MEPETPNDIVTAIVSIGVILFLAWVAFASYHVVGFVWGIFDTVIGR